MSCSSSANRSSGSGRGYRGLVHGLPESVRWRVTCAEEAASGDRLNFRGDLLAEQPMAPCGRADGSFDRIRPARLIEQPGIGRANSSCQGPTIGISRTKVATPVQRSPSQRLAVGLHHLLGAEQPTGADPLRRPAARCGRRRPQQHGRKRQRQGQHDPDGTTRHKHPHPASTLPHPRSPAPSSPWPRPPSVALRHLVGPRRACCAIDKRRARIRADPVARPWRTQPLVGASHHAWSDGRSRHGRGTGCGPGSSKPARQGRRGALFRRSGHPDRAA
jgi:hypothetical protein